jgi:pimeloyl-ACP methyl ester carboxylesterase
MLRLLVLLGSLIALVGALLVWGALSGRQPPFDSVTEGQNWVGLPLESSLVEAHGIRLHVVQAGPKQGPPVILLHGYPEFWFGWHRQLGALAGEGFRVIAPDQRGYGLSDKPSDVDAYRVSVLEEDVLALATALGHERFALAGHDWGGTIAWHVAAEHPERVSRLLIVNMGHPLAFEELSAAGGTRDTVSWYRTFFRVPRVPELLMRIGNWAPLVKSLRDSAQPGIFPEEELRFYRPAWDEPGAMRAMLNWYRAAGRNWHRVAGDGRVKAPTQILWGVKDAFLDPRLAQRSAGYCDTVQVTEFEDAGHWLLHEEAGMTSWLMLEFLRGR